MLMLFELLDKWCSRVVLAGAHSFRAAIDSPPILDTRQPRIAGL